MGLPLKKVLSVKILPRLRTRVVVVVVVVVVVIVVVDLPCPSNLGMGCCFGRLVKRLWVVVSEDYVKPNISLVMASLTVSGPFEGFEKCQSPATP